MLLNCGILQVDSFFCVVSPAASGVQVRSMHPPQIWMLPPVICKMSKTNVLISPLTDLRHLTASSVASIEPPWLEKTYFQKFICM
jgi:hypothetical protein